MEKVKLAIGMGDLTYQERFISCLISHYKNKYEIHAFLSKKELLETEAGEYELIITGDFGLDELSGLIEKGDNVLFLQENPLEEDEGEFGANLTFEEKYQEVYKIVDVITLLTKDSISRNRDSVRTGTSYKLIGVVSLSNPQLQLPFSAMLSSICGQKEKTLLIDIQEHSGLASLIDEDIRLDHSSIEDFFAMATMKTYTKGRILAGIGSEQRYDFVYPVKNTKCLLEADEKMYQDMFQMISDVGGYKVLVLNIGILTPERYKLMEDCDKLFFLEAENELGKWRELDLSIEMQKRESEESLCKMTRISLPSPLGRDTSWKRLAEKWEFNSIGDGIREQLWTVISHG